MAARLALLANSPGWLAGWRLLTGDAALSRYALRMRLGCLGQSLSLSSRGGPPAKMPMLAVNTSALIVHPPSPFTSRPPGSCVVAAVRRLFVSCALRPALALTLSPNS